MKGSSNQINTIKFNLPSVVKVVTSNRSKVEPYVNIDGDVFVVKVVTSNRSKVEPYVNIDGDVFERLLAGHARIDPFGQHENNEIFD